MTTKKEIIYGNTPSKSNSYKIIRMGGRCSLMKSKAMKAYEDKFYMQLSGELRGLMIEGLFEFEIDVYYPSMRSDLDGVLKAVLDCLQKTKTIKNDNKCVKIIARKFVDKENPRVEFTLTEL